MARRWVAVLLGGGVLVLATSCAAPAEEPSQDSVSAEPKAAAPAAPVRELESVATPTATADDSPDPSPTTRSAAGTALATLETLAVKGRAPMTAYDRDAFGQAWLDTDRNGCDTRNDTLTRHLEDRAYETGTRGCVVSSGLLHDAYTGTAIRFVKGDGFLVDIDHVVPLGNAWATGAQRWPAKKRAALANDPLNLLPVDAAANRQKGDGDAATWLPPNKGYRCEYVARQVSVKAKYGLWVTPAEAGAISHVLSACPGHLLPRDSGAPTTAPVDVGTPRTRPAAGQPVTRGTGHSPRGGSASVHFVNCDAARAAGAAPVHVRDAGYGRHLDRDGDGSGCE
jgi:hypothetical protein